MPRHQKTKKSSDRKPKAASEGARAQDSAGSPAAAPHEKNSIAATADGGAEGLPITNDASPAASQNAPGVKRPFFKRSLDSVGAFVKHFKVELLTTLLTLTLSLGNYFYSSINTRMTIATLWRDGYTSETRNQVAKFRIHQRVWKDARELDEKAPDPLPTVDKLVDPDLLFSKS